MSDSKKRVKLEVDATGCPTNRVSWYEDNCRRIHHATHRGYWSIIHKCERDVAVVPCERTRRQMVGEVRQYHIESLFSNNKEGRT